MKTEKVPLTAPFTGKIRLLVCFEIVDNVADGDELVEFLVFDLNAEFVLAHHSQVVKLDGIDVQVALQLCLHGDGALVQLQLLNQEILESFKHWFVLQIYHM